MNLRISLATALLSTSLIAQTAPPAPKPMPMPAAVQVAGAGADKVWVNTASNVYHCPGDRYYGKTRAGKYMTEAAARATGAHGEKGQVCFK
jgi:hypothetical protein